MVKDTTKIVEELGLSPDFKSFYNENKDYMVKEDLSQLLNTFIMKYDLKKSQVIRAAEMSEVYGYHIFAGSRVPERNKALALAIGMGLNLDQVQQLLRTAGYSTLYAKHPFDSVVLYGLYHAMSVAEINELLYEYNLETLG